MSAQSARPMDLMDFDEARSRYDLDRKNKRLGLQLWRFANSSVFLFFAFANYLIRATQGSWPPPGVARLDATLPAVFSVVLLLSALPASLVTAAIQREDRRAMQRHILVTVVLGLAFLIGLVLIWQQVPYSGSYSAIFFTMTGFHAVHVVVGMLLFGYIFVKARRGAYSKKNYWSVEGTVIFWHFVELMWVFYFVVLYVL
jgi:cytochrome c oxidase subunit 3